MFENSIKLVFLGPPGCGKGTQATRTSKQYGIVQLSTGDMLRKAIKLGSDVGKQAKVFMDKGELVPSSVVIDVLKERMSESDCEKGYILDGFPRSLEQASLLQGMFDKSSERLSAVVNFEVSDEEVVLRLSGRRVCKGCPSTYHVKFNPPKNGVNCDSCSNELYQRDDDNEATVRNRLKVYREHTMPLIDFYNKLGLLRNIDGQREIDMIFSDLCSLIDGLMK